LDASSVGIVAKIEDGINRIMVEGSLSIDVINFIKDEELDEV
jgi:hypothetical protein